METARLLSTVLHIAAHGGAKLPQGTSPSAVQAAVDLLIQQGLLLRPVDAGELRLTAAGEHLLDRLGRCTGGRNGTPLWCWDGKDFGPSH